MASNIFFVGGITPDSTATLRRHLGQFQKVGETRVNLGIYTGGGDLASAWDVYNFIRDLPMEVVTYNLGACCSAGVLIFLAGSQRYVVSRGFFLLHEAKVSSGQHTGSFSGRTYDLAAIFSERTGFPLREAMAYFGSQDRIVFPSEAAQMGLIHDVSPLYVADDDVTIDLEFLEMHVPPGR